MTNRTNLFLYYRMQVAVLLMLGMVQSRIIDYSHSNYIPIIDGKVLVWEQRDYLRHSSNLTEFDVIADETEKLIELFPQSHMRKLLDADIDHIRSLLSVVQIHHRMARSLDFLGSALKVIAGTPDASDFEKVRWSESQLIDASNKQIVINSETQEKINKLTDAVNEIIKAKKNDVVDTPHLYETLLARNRILINQISNLILTITLAKANIINPTIFEHNDLKAILNEHPLEIPIVSLTEASKIKVLQSENIIHILIAYPRAKFICKKVTIYPVSHQHVALQLSDDTVAECNDDVLAVTECVATTYASVCKFTAQESCARALHAGSAASCRTQPSHLNPITFVDDGVIIINESAAKISTDDGPEVTTNGTHLVTFRSSATINGTRYVNERGIMEKAPGIAGSPLLNIIGHDPVLSMPQLHRMNNLNLQVIKNFKGELAATKASRNLASFGIILSIIFSSLIFVWLLIRKWQASRKVEKIINSYKVTEVGQQLEGGVVNT